MPKFNVEVSYEVTEVYEIEAKDADFARIKATSIYPYAPIDRRVCGKRVESITQVTPRYEIKEYDSNMFVIIDTLRGNESVATARHEWLANNIIDALNTEEDMR